MMEVFVQMPLGKYDSLKSVSEYLKGKLKEGQGMDAFILDKYEESVKEKEEDTDD